MVWQGQGGRNAVFKYELSTELSEARAGKKIFILSELVGGTDKLENVKAKIEDLEIFGVTFSYAVGTNDKINIFLLLQGKVV